MTTPVSLTAVACPRCGTLLYRHAELGMVELMRGERHDALLCAARRTVARLLAEDSPWEDIDT